MQQENNSDQGHKRRQWQQGWCDTPGPSCFAGKGREYCQKQGWEKQTSDFGRERYTQWSHKAMAENISDTSRHSPFVGKWFKWTARIMMTVHKLHSLDPLFLLWPSFLQMVIPPKSSRSMLWRTRPLYLNTTNQSSKRPQKDLKKSMRTTSALPCKTPRDQSRQCHAHVLLYAPTPNPRNTSSTGSGQPATVTKEECTNECYNESTTLQGNKHCDHTEHIHLTRKWETKRPAVAKQQPRSSLGHRCFENSMKMDDVRSHKAWICSHISGFWGKTKWLPTFHKAFKNTGSFFVVKFAVIKCRQTLARLGESFTKHPRPLPIISTTIGIKRLRTVALKTFKCSSPPQKNVSNVTSSKQDPNFLTKKERECISVMFRIPSILGFNNFEPRPYTLAIYVEEGYLGTFDENEIIMSPLSNKSSKFPCMQFARPYYRL